MSVCCKHSSYYKNKVLLYLFDCQLFILFKSCFYVVLASYWLVLHLADIVLNYTFVVPSKHTCDPYAAQIDQAVVPVLVKM